MRIGKDGLRQELSSLTFVAPLTPFISSILFPRNLPRDQLFCSLGGDVSCFKTSSNSKYKRPSQPSISEKTVGLHQVTSRCDTTGTIFQLGAFQDFSKLF